MNIEHICIKNIWWQQMYGGQEKHNKNRWQRSKQIGEMFICIFIESELHISWPIVQCSTYTHIYYIDQQNVTYVQMLMDKIHSHLVSVEWTTSVQNRKSKYKTTCDISIIYICMRLYNHFDCSIWNRQCKCSVFDLAHHTTQCAIAHSPILIRNHLLLLLLLCNEK